MLVGPDRKLAFPDLFCDNYAEKFLKVVVWVSSIGRTGKKEDSDGEVPDTEVYGQDLDLGFGCN